MKKCNQLLTDSKHYRARCTQVWGIEHDHSDKTAKQAVEQKLAKKLKQGEN